jgi:hypothetical protein
MSKTQLARIEKKFLKQCFTLDRDDMLKVDKEDNGPINNVIANLSEKCYGVRLYEIPGDYQAEMFYINNSHGLKGDIIILDLKDPDYFELLLNFCYMLSVNYTGADAIDSFNTFQSKLRSFLEKLGFFTFTDKDIEPFQGQHGVAMTLAPKGFKKIKFIDKVDYYRSFFNENYRTKVTSNNGYVYLMVNTDTSFIKIGFSKNPGYRERTLHSQEPNIHLIACWEGSIAREKELHNKFHQKRIRGEWFRLNFDDMKSLEGLMD